MKGKAHSRLARALDRLGRDLAQARERARRAFAVRWSRLSQERTLQAELDFGLLHYVASLHPTP